MADIAFDIDNFILQADVLNHIFSGDTEAVNLTASVEANIGRWINAAYGIIKSSLGYSFIAETHTENYNGNDTHFLFLKHKECTLIQSISNYDTEISLLYFSIHEDKNQIVYNYNYGKFTRGIRNYSIKYDAGFTYSTLPAVIREVGLQIISILSGKADSAGKASEARKEHNISYIANPYSDILYNISDYMSTYDDSN